MRVLVIFNPTAGRRRLHRLQRYVRTLRGEGVAVSVSATTHAGHARVVAQDAAQGGAFSHIVAAGGDGTIAEVADGMGDAPVTLGILPLGTANVMAHELGLAFRPEESARALACGATCEIWPGVFTLEGRSRLFLQMVGVGFDAAVVHDISLPLKRRLGKGAYVWQTVATLGRYAFPRFDVSLDGVPDTACAVVISNGRYYGGRFVMAPEADPRSPGFCVSLLDRPGIAGIAATGLGLMLGEPRRTGAVRRREARVVSVSGAIRAPVQHDGDASGHTPLEVRPLPHPLRVAVG